MGGVPIWICPECNRQFGRVRQGHECAPAMSLEAYFSTGPPHERPICEAVMAYCRTLGPLHVEPVSVGIFLKRARTFAELRPMRAWEALSFSLSRPQRHRLIARKVLPYGGRYFHVVNLGSPADVDGDIRNWLAEAYLASPV
jgi:hypothetical protein